MGITKVKGANLATLASTSKISKDLIMEVETSHQKIKLTKYFKPDLA